MSVVSLEMLAWIIGTVVVCRLAPERRQPLVLAAVTLVFLCLHAVVSAVLLVVLTTATYWLPRLWRPAPRAMTAVGGFIVGLLIVFKAGVGTLAAAAATPGLAAPSVIMPLGFSYYAFRCLHYLIESHKDTLPRHGFVDVVGYLFFLPTLVAGPIHRFPDYLRDLRDRGCRRWDGPTFAEGCERILFGLAQVVVLGNWLASTKLQTVVAGLDPSRTALIAYLDCLRFGLNVYFQFAGYSSIAIGFALLLGFRVMENFDWPLLKPNITGFWRSWHMSLSSWCRDYVYMPVASSTRNVALGALATMIAIALWHELSLRYLGWGLYHAAGIIVWQQFQALKSRLPPPSGVFGVFDHPASRWLRHGLAVALTFNFVILSFAFTKETGLSATLGVYRAILGGL